LSFYELIVLLFSVFKLHLFEFETQFLCFDHVIIML